MHVPTKEEDTTLSFWKSPKAGLYLDLHNMIRNNNLKSGKENLIKRLFVFRDNAHLAYLDSTGVGVIFEQQSIGIKTGFILMREQDQTRAVLIKGGTVLIELMDPNNEENCEWALLIDKTHETNMPYGNQMVCKWHRGRLRDPQTGDFTKEEHEHINIEQYVKLFDFQFKKAEEKARENSYFFEENPDGFRRLLCSNFDHAYPGIKAPKEDYEAALNYKAIPTTLRQFHLALAFMRESAGIIAVDASSVKSTLKIHDADPNYRHWIRASVNLAIPKNKLSLERIFILDLSKENDYKILKQEIASYRDFLDNRISNLNAIWPINDTGKTDQVSPIEQSLPICVYVVTKRVIEVFCQRLRDEHQRMIYALLKDDFIPEEDKREEITSADITRLLITYMSRLDFLCTEKLIFNYKDYRGEPGQAVYDADLFIPGDPANDIEAVLTHFASDQFEAKREVYIQLFNILKSLSIVIPLTKVSEASSANQSINLPEPEELEDQLREKCDDRIEHLDSLYFISQQPMEDATAVEKPKIFLSYARKDKDAVDKLYRDLTNSNCLPWQDDKDITGGENFELAIAREVDNSDFFIACLSTNSVNREGYIQKELKWALDKWEEKPGNAIYIIPVRLDEECKMPVELERLKLQYINLYEENGFNKILEAIKEGIKRKNSMG
jgi:hypothetical protein